MIYVSEFCLPAQEQEEYFFTPKNPNYKLKNYRTVYTTKYPFALFWERDFPRLELEDITILCGNNGSGKSTVLNVMAEKLELSRESPYNRSDFFEDYTELCSYVVDRKISADSCIITSDDVFEKVLDIRRLNLGIDNRREELINEYISGRYYNDKPNLLEGMDDYDRWKRNSDIRRKKTTESQFIRKNLVRNVQERSNGESALSYFVDRIADGGLYLLDEPENSLSPANQIQLKYFIEDCVRHHSCQFVISTHSPFLLSLRRAKIYDLDSVPITMVRRWTDLECIRIYYDFFEENKEQFE